MRAELVRAASTRSGGNGTGGSGESDASESCRKRKAATLVAADSNRQQLYGLRCPDPQCELSQRIRLPARSRGNAPRINAVFFASFALYSILWPDRLWGRGDACDSRIMARIIERRDERRAKVRRPLCRILRRRLFLVSIELTVNDGAIWNARREVRNRRL